MKAKTELKSKKPQATKYKRGQIIMAKIPQWPVNGTFTLAFIDFIPTFHKTGDQ